jgi:hypothetical protein
VASQNGSLSTLKQRHGNENYATKKTESCECKFFYRGFYDSPHLDAKIQILTLPRFSTFAFCPPKTARLVPFGNHLRNGEVELMLVNKLMET